jgi:hypothetical protein
MQSFWQSKIGAAVQTGAASLSKAAAGLQGGDAATHAEVAPDRSRAAGPSNGGEKQYLRLPMESARKLRWYDKQDLPNILRSHVAEKRELTSVAHLAAPRLQSAQFQQNVDYLALMTASKLGGIPWPVNNRYCGPVPPPGVAAINGTSAALF